MRHLKALSGRFVDCNRKMAAGRSSPILVERHAGDACPSTRCKTCHRNFQSNESRLQQGQSGSWGVHLQCRVNVAMQCYAVLCGAMQCQAVLYGTMRCGRCTCQVSAVCLRNCNELHESRVNKCQRPVHEYGPPPNMKIQPNPNPTMS